MRIYVLHEYGDKNHYKALENLAKKKGYTVEYYEFGITKNFLKGLIKKNFFLLKKQINNIKFLFNLLFTKNKKIILGIAPYDSRLLFLEYFLKKHQVYYHTSWVYWDGDFYPKKRFVNTFIKNRWKKFLEQKVKYIFVVSKASKNSLLDNYDISNNKIKVVYHSFEKDIFYYRNRDINKNFIFVGRLEKEKGLEEILEFFSKAQECNLLIAGKGKLLNLVKKYENRFKNIKYLGFLNKKELAKYYNSVSFLILNSKRQKHWEELFGMVIIEAMACGVIPITTNHKGPLEIIDDNINGFIFKEDEFIKGLNFICTTFYNKEFLDKIKKNAIKKSQEFTIESISKRWEKIFE